MSRITTIVVILVIFQNLLLRESSGVAVQNNIQWLKKIGEEVKSTLSLDRDPCMDFYGYVCAKSNGTRQRLSDIDTMSPIIENYLLKSEKLTNIEEKLKTYLKTCKEYKDDDLKKFVSEFDLAESIGGWPAFDSNWKADKFNWKTAMAELETYYTSVIIDQNFEILPITFKSQLTVGLTDFDLTQSALKKEKLLKKLSKLGIDNVDEVINDAVKFEEECNGVVSADKSNEEHKEETDLTGLQKEIPEIDWNKQLNIVADEKMVNDFTVVIKDGEILKKLIDKVSKMNPKIVANYFFCNFVYNLPNLEKDNLDKKCVELGIKNFLSAVFELLIKEYFNGNSKILLSEMFESLLQTLRDSSYIIEGTKIADITEDIDKFLESYRLVQLNKEYENVEVDDSSFLCTTYSLRRNNYRNIVHQFACGNSGDLGYLQQMLLRMISYDLHITSNQPSFSAYTAIALDPIKDYVEVLRSRGIKNAIVECISDHDEADDITDRRISGRIFSKLVVKGYFDWANKNEDILQAEDEILKEYDLTSRKIFLIRFLQSACGSEDPESTKRISSFFWSLDQFVNTFSCGADPPVKALKKCEL